MTCNSWRAERPDAVCSLVDALRGIMVEARGWADVSPELLILGVCLVVPFAVALKIFCWQ